MWRKSSFSGDPTASDCVEVALTDEGVVIRDSKNADGSMLRFSTEAWHQLQGAEAILSAMSRAACS
ncbi:MAG TPA: DUF397 domain-containing protein [Actinophytocola sp.]|nr:DUF397 domain-containing protein [Actinophytocola sp.]HEV2780276.1 DUF397 domain-containing protein [Actinophytocola sp.]